MTTTEERGPATAPATAPAADEASSTRRRQDAALALAVIIPEVFYFGTPLLPGVDWGQRLGILALALPEAVALALRRRAPVAVFAVVWLISTGADLLTLHHILNFTPYFGLLVALYTVAERRRPPPALTALLLCAVPAGLSSYLVIDGTPADYLRPVLGANVSFYLPVTLATWGLARWGRAARAAAERNRRELAEARDQVARERRQLARELHDIVANAVAVIVLRAETARVASRTDAARVDALAHIEQIGRSTTNELRYMLRLLRTADGGTRPVVRHGLADLAGLLADVRRTGVRIRLETRGIPLRIDDSVAQTAYRLVQEACTNITKHAGPGTHAVVRITWSTTLHVEVVDDGAGRPPSEHRELSTGHGLLGLSERVALFGGRLTAGPFRSGFRVAAVLPAAPAVTLTPGGAAATTAATPPTATTVS
ncbi:histidine kinase [Kitasatospora sp. NPDC093806]|uniref:sensor histidine kinase n=1 Tax=Kitasatospora sp. NPDC093806 TaxID=3155075 RepID=UPI0034303790